MIADTAKIHSSAKIGKDVHIGEYSIIGADVTLGDGCRIGPHVVINGPTIMGKNNHVFQFASIGEAPQDKKFLGENSNLIVGDNNTFREFVTVSRGTEQGGGKTTIGHDNLFMNYVHIAHDCEVSNHSTFSNNASLAGHVKVGDYANLGGFVGVHQFCSIGAHSFCAGASIIVKDVLPFVMVSGHPAQVFGLNLVGLKRRDFTNDTVIQLKRAYKVLYRQGLTVDNALVKLKDMAQDCSQVMDLVTFIKASSRGFVR